MKKQIKSLQKYRFNTFTPDDAQESVEITGHLVSQINYDVNGNIIESKTFNTEEEIEEHLQYFFDDKGKKTKEFIFVDEEIAETHHYLYDQNNNIIKESIIYQDDISDTLTYEYNSNQKIIKRTLVDSDDEIESVTIYVYLNENYGYQFKYHLPWKIE